MKKTILPAIAWATAGFLFSPFFLFAQTDITVQDDAKVGLIVTGTGNTINTTQIFGKSPEYAELKKRLDGLVAAIAKKADECEQMAKDSLPSKYRDGCRADLIALNLERDSVQKIETRFREDVIRLAENFSKIELNSERLRLAKQFFDDGKIREAEALLSFKEITQEGDALLMQKENQAAALRKTEGSLRIKAEELSFKARLKAADYADSLRYDSAAMYFEQSLRYDENVLTLWDFADLLRENEPYHAINIYERALELTNAESTKVYLSISLGWAYLDVEDTIEAEKVLLRASEINKRLANSDTAQYEVIIEESLESEIRYYYTKPDLAETYRQVGLFYQCVQRRGEAEKMYLRSLEIYEQLAKANPAQFERYLAAMAMNLGLFYSDVQKMAESEKMYLRSLDIAERLAKANPGQFEPYLVKIIGNLSWFYLLVKKSSEAQSAAERTLALDPTQNWVRTALGHSHLLRGDWDKAKQIYEQYIANEKDPAEAKAALLKDWDDLEKAGVTHKDMAKARAWVKE